MSSHLIPVEKTEKPHLISCLRIQEGDKDRVILTPYLFIYFFREPKSAPTRWGPGAATAMPSRPPPPVGVSLSLCGSLYE